MNSKALLRLLSPILIASIAFIICFASIASANDKPNPVLSLSIHNSPLTVTSCETISIPLNTSKIEFINAAYGEPTILGDGHASVFSDMSEEHGGSNYYEGGLQITYTEIITFTTYDWITITISSDDTGASGYNSWRIYYTDSSYEAMASDTSPGPSVPGRDNDIVGFQPASGKELDFFSASWGRPWWSEKATSEIQYNSIEIYRCTETEFFPLSCSTVDDYHFSGVITDTWLLESATISDSILTLDPGGIAAQNLITLTSNSDYNAVISVTNATTYPASIDLILGTETEAIDITESDYYTATFTTPYLGGPLAYALENTSAGSNTIEIDYTCLFLIGEGQPECLAPTNGDFDTADNWYWYRGAAHQSVPQNAFLPFNEGDEGDKSLLLSAITYTMPSLNEDEYLLLKFAGETQLDQAAVLATRAASGITETIYFFEIYPYVYEFQADISDMAGLDDVSLAFANAGEDPLTGFTAEDNIYLDDVCIYISDEPPDLPGPVDTDPLPPAPTGSWTCSSCSEIPGLLYGYGISVYYLDEIYANGVSVWDPEGWVPWLAAALWINAGYPLACFILTLWCWLLGLYQYLLNQFLNYFFWILRSGIAFAAWLPLFVTWLALNLVNLVELAGDWLLWFAQAVSDFSQFLPLLLAILSQWIFGGFIWLASNIFGFDFLFQLWNLAVPLLQAIWSYISSVSLFALIISFLLSFVGSGWDLFIMLITWIWENIFQGISFPLQFYNAFDAGVSSSSFDYLLSCESQNFWCSLLAGFQIINQTASHSIMYPAIIVGIIVTTLFIFWKDIRALFSINVK